ncbi:MAG: hypothetical protein ACLTTP_08335 [Alistipes ihumii]
MNLKERAKWALWDMRSAGPCTGLCRWTVIWKTLSGMYLLGYRTGIGRSAY